MYYRIIYLSSAEKNISSTEISNLLFKSRENNKIKNISGLLLFLDGNFIQILEGEKESVIELYNKIQLDTRHKNILKVIEDEIPERQFENWKMGYSKIDSLDLKKNDDFKNFNFKNIFSKTDFIAETFISTFLKCHRNMIE